MATVTNVRDQPCRQHFASALSDILVEEGEELERAQKVVDHAETIGVVFDYGPRPLFCQLSVRGGLFVLC